MAYGRTLVLALLAASFLTACDVPTETPSRLPPQPRPTASVSSLSSCGPAPTRIAEVEATGLPRVWTIDYYSPPISSLPGFGSWWSALVDASEATRLRCHATVGGRSATVQSVSPAPREWWEDLPDFPAPPGVRLSDWNKLGKKMQAQIYAVAVAMEFNPMQPVVDVGIEFVSIDYRSAVHNENVRRKAGQLAETVLNAMSRGKATFSYLNGISESDPRAAAASMFVIGCELYALFRSPNEITLSTAALTNTREILMAMAEGSPSFTSPGQRVLAGQLAYAAAGIAHERWPRSGSCVQKALDGITLSTVSVTESNVFHPPASGGGGGGGGGTPPSPEDPPCIWRDALGRCISEEPTRALLRTSPQH